MDKPYLHPKFAHLQKEYDSVVQCNRCGFCETICPTYMVSGKETLSPRGRNQAFRQILEGKIKNPASASEIFSTCLTCHACTNVCFSQVPVANLMAHARSIVEEEGSLATIWARCNPLKIFLRILQFSWRWVKKSSLGRFTFYFFLSHRKFFSILLWFTFLLKRAYFSRILKTVHLLKLISPELDAAEELIERVPLWFGGGNRDKKLWKGREKKQEVSYFSGCGIHYLYPQVSRSCIRILESFFPQLNLPNHSCCGLIAHSAGDLKSAKMLAKKNISEFIDSGVNTIIVNDDSCCGFMKSYSTFLEGNIDATAFSNKVKNLSEFLMEFQSPKSNVQSPKPELQKKKVTYHDPCQMGNGHQQFNAPREILKGLPTVSFIEMEEANWCCGGAGSYCLKHPHLAEEVLERKLLNIKQSGAEIVVTQASSCLIHIQYGIRKKGWQDKIKVVHLAELL